VSDQRSSMQSKYLSVDEHLPKIKTPVVYNGGFFTAAVQAFRFHKILVMNPDTFLHALLAQVGVLITKHPELFRDDLVNHSGQLHITANDESDMWKMFADHIDVKNEAFKTLLNLKFSTTTDELMVVRYGMIAATFSPYYQYYCTECGLRGVRVQGNTEDWLTLKASLDGGLGFLNKINIQDNSRAANADTVLEWIADTKLIIDRCVELLTLDETVTKQSTEIVEWWRGFVTEEGRSGGPFIGGHMTGMMLINNKGELIDRRRNRNLVTQEVPTEQLFVTVKFRGGPRDGPRKYLVGNVFTMSDDDTECITTPKIQEEEMSCTTTE
jgi:hypothetical protein